MDRSTIRKKKQDLLREKKHIESSEAWDSDIKEVAMAKLQQHIGSLELYEKELLPVEAKMRQMGSRTQSVRGKHRAREGQIEKLQILRH